MGIIKAIDYVNIALKYENYHEKLSNENLEDFSANAGNNNYTRFNRDYGVYTGVGETYWQGQPWCAMFTSVIMVELCKGNVKKAKEMLCGDLFCACIVGYNNFKAKNRIFKEPKVGDIIFFLYPDLSYSMMAHVGIVYKVDSNRVYTIEGNTSIDDGVVANGGGVERKSYRLDYNRIAGYGRPIGFFDGDDTVISNEEKLEKEPIKTTLVNKDYVVNVAANSSLNVRNNPNTNSYIIDTLKRGKVVTISKKTNDNWGYIESLDGWVSMNFLTLAPKIDLIPVTGSKVFVVTNVDKGDVLNIRKGPSTNYDIITTLKNGQTVHINKKTNNGWGYIQNLKGYASMSYLEPLQIKKKTPKKPNLFTRLTDRINLTK